MKKIQLLLILLFSTLTTRAQYYPNFANMSFYDQFSGKQDLHYNDGWTRDTNSITLTNSVITVPIKTGTTHYVQTGFLQLMKNDVISFDHRITNSSGSGILDVSYVDSLGNQSLLKTITYSSANGNTMTDTIKVNMDKRVRVRFTYTKVGGNNNVRFEMSMFSAVGVIPLPIKPKVERPKQTVEVVEDEVLIYNIFGVCVYEGLLSDFYKIGEKGQMYFTERKKFIIY